LPSNPHGADRTVALVEHLADLRFLESDLNEHTPDRDQQASISSPHLTANRHVRRAVLRELRQWVTGGEAVERVIGKRDAADAARRSRSGADGASVGGRLVN
jgi:hypothetical protein